MDVKATKIVKTIDMIGIICVLIGAGVLFRTTCLIGVQDIWYDELFTVKFASMPIKDMLVLASQDVHPPLYYIYVRIIYLIVKVFSSSITVVTAAKLASIIPYFLIILYSVIFVRRDFGWLSAGLTILFVEMMPQLSQYMVEARMYSLAMFIIFAMFLHGMRALEGEYVHLVVACLYGIAAMYTHYYALIGAASIAFCMLIYVLGDKTNEKKIKISHVLICMLVCVVSYIPWISSALAQTGAVSTNYWIQPVSIKTIPGCIKYIFKPDFESGLINVACAGIFALVYIILYWKFFRCSIDVLARFKVICTTGVPVVLVLAGIVASVLIRPVFVYRYMVPVLGIFWMGYAILCATSIYGFFDNDKQDYLQYVFAVAAFVILILSSFIMKRDINLFNWEEEKKTAGMEVSNHMFDLINREYSDNMLVCNFNQVQDILWYYLDNPSILWGETDELLIADICDRAPVVMIDDVHDIPQEPFLFVGSGNARDEIIAMWSDAGREIEELVDSALIERYYVNIYLVK